MTETPDTPAADHPSDNNQGLPALPGPSGPRIATILVPRTPDPPPSVPVLVSAPPLPPHIQPAPPPFAHLVPLAVVEPLAVVVPLALPPDHEYYVHIPRSMLIRFAFKGVNTPPVPNQGKLFVLSLCFV